MNNHTDAIAEAMTRARARRHLAGANAAAGDTMQAVPRTEWPEHTGRSVSQGVWRSRRFLAVAYADHVTTRLSVNRTQLADGGRWVDGITWDELMQVKRECGFAERWAVEVYPPDHQVVDVANIRHLWMLDCAPAFAWLPAFTTSAVESPQRLSP